MNSNLESVLETQEKIIWEGMISRRVLSFILSFKLLFWLFFTAFLFATSPQSSNFNYFVSLVILFFILLNFFKKYVKEFTITDKRLIICSGIIGVDYNSIYFTKIKTVNVQVSLINKIFSVGTINIDTGKIETISNNKNNLTQTAYDKLESVDSPYEIYKILQSALSKRQESLYSGRVDLK